MKEEEAVDGLSVGCADGVPASGAEAAAAAEEEEEEEIDTDGMTEMFGLLVLSLTSLSLRLPPSLLLL